jgi:hypothetical protein
MMPNRQSEMVGEVVATGLDTNQSTILAGFQSNIM